MFYTVAFLSLQREGSGAGEFSYFCRVCDVKIMRLSTEVAPGHSKFSFSYSDRITVLGSCFADNIGSKLLGAGFDACVNPFGTLYNPLSLRSSFLRLASGEPFSEADCEQMGAGAGLVCSFSHHTSFARPTAGEFLEVANEKLSVAAEFFSRSNLVLITLGTAWVFEHGGKVVSNCLKRDAREFTRRRLSVGECTAALGDIVTRFPRKKFIFTLSPIRHLKDGAHGNQISKATLLLALDDLLSAFPDRTEYFPAYEIVLDELRDYRFYADDMCHPSSLAVDILWERFLSFALDPSQKEELLTREKLSRRSQHRPLH